MQNLRIEQKMLQKLSPQQIQLMKLLQIPTATLEQRIEEELEANPALEEGDRAEDQNEYNAEEGEAAEGEEYGEEAFELDDYLAEYIEDDPSSYKLKDNSIGGDEEEKQAPLAVENTFHDYLEQQLGLLEIGSEKEEAIALQIIGSIDEDGYLRREPSAIIDDLMFAKNIYVTESEVLDILALIQRFEPAGVGAKDLQECLSIQLSQKMEQEEEEDCTADFPMEIMQVAKKIIDNYFSEFTKKHYDKLIRNLDIAEEELKEAIDVILKLNPKPASGYNSSGSRASQYVVPDFIIINREGELELTLNARNAPDLKINDQYKDMLQSYQSSSRAGKKNKQQKEAVKFIKQKIDSARWFIDAIRQRQQTMFKTMYAILQYQYDYFLTGDQRKLRPMILKDIAEITGLDISTISRVANSKFVQTEFGTKRLKEFFSEAMQNQEGESVSTLQIKKILSEIIEEENKRKPLSDEKLKQHLKAKGYNIARRTVAKYREQLNIPVARLRKEL